MTETETTDLVHQVPAWKWNKGVVQRVSEPVVRAALVELTLNGRSLVRLYCLPDKLEDLALGFLAGEGIVTAARDLSRIDIDESGARIKCEAQVNIDALVAFLEKAVVTSSCGGGLSRGEEASLEAVKSETIFAPEVISARMGQFQKQSSLFRLTGGVHSAAATDASRLLLFAEDISRHNALDKVVGACLRQGLDVAELLFLSSGRITVDMVMKLARVGVPLVVSRSAPTDRALALADRLGMCVVGFARARHMNIYTAPWRLGLENAE